MRHLLEIAHQAAIPISLDLNLRGLGREEPQGFCWALDQAIDYANVVFGSDSDEFNYLYPGLSAEDAARRIADESRTVVIRMAELGSEAVMPRESCAHRASR